MDRLTRLRAMLDESPDDAFLRFAHGQELRNRGDAEGALAAWSALRDNDPDYVGVYYHLAELLAETGRREEAEACYADGIAAAQRAGDAHALGELRNAYQNFRLGL